MNSISLALGGGGARGLGHLKVLEFFEQEQIKISRISGSSMGAIVGALYASGKDSKTIQEELKPFLIFEGDRKRDVVKKVPRLLSWLSMLNFDFHRPGLVQADTFLQNFIDDLETKTFEDLEIPLTIIATDYWTGEEVVLNSGPLKPAMTASSAIPGIFPAVEHQGRVLVDGSLSNAVPFSHFCQGDDLCVAIDVAPHRVPKKKNVPSIRDASEGMFDIFFDKMVEYQKKESPPDVYFRPGIENVGILDFDKVESIYDQVDAKLPELKQLCRGKGLEM